jgi:uncharacterized membrane protein (UPF0127 family)
MHRILRIVAAAVIVITTLGFVTWVVNREDNSGCLIRIDGPNYDCIHLERVKSAEALQHGLSGRTSMPQDQGMLFIFDHSAKHCFWMKDMHFPLDILWMDGNKTVVHVETNVQPDSYPQSFCPDQNARYVLELNAGVAAKAHLAEYSRLQF